MALSGACAETIAAFHGSQCGFCTPGMVVACHAAVAKARATGGEPAPEAMEKALDGNLCRCTGYRPILDACKVPALAPPPCHSVPVYLRRNGAEEHSHWAISGWGCRNSQFKAVLVPALV